MKWSESRCEFFASFSRFSDTGGAPLLIRKTGFNGSLTYVNVLESAEGRSAQQQACSPRSSWLFGSFRSDNAALFMFFIGQVQRDCEICAISAAATEMLIFHRVCTGWPKFAR